MNTSALATDLQEGIYWHSKVPRCCYRLLLLNIKGGTARGEAGEAIAAVWAMLQRLRAGQVDELQPRPSDRPLDPVASGELTCLLGFGTRLFARYPMMTRPEDLSPLGHQPFPSLPWVPPADRRTGEADLALQFIAQTDLAVDRAAVEVWMFIESRSLPLEIVTLYGGFNRDDARGWLGFHDGLNNIESTQRPAAIVAADQPPAWMHGGTYMGFLRLALDLAAWRRLPRERQEIIVGRDKLTGCPLEKIDPPLRPVIAPGCPVVGTMRATTARYVNPPPPPVRQSLLRESHIHRANPNRDVPGRRESNRIFRQGYEFVEALGDGHLRLGVNFVSFQSHLTHLTNILRTPGWLGDVNFGGPAYQQPGGPDPIHMVTVIAGGYYAVPPKATPFPGAAIF